jgi:hypothetical protein
VGKNYEIIVISEYLILLKLLVHVVTALKRTKIYVFVIFILFFLELHSNFGLRRTSFFVRLGVLFAYLKKIKSFKFIILKTDGHLTA